MAIEATGLHCRCRPCSGGMALRGMGAADRSVPAYRCAHGLGRRRSSIIQRIDGVSRGLQERGWKIGSNLQIDYRWSAGNLELKRKYASELVALVPDVVLAAGGTFVGALQQVSRTVPIVFVEVTDPVNRGLVASLARPGGNTTGFTQFEFSISGKWLELLKQIAPNVKRAAVIRDPSKSRGSASSLLSRRYRRHWAWRSARLTRVMPAVLSTP